MTYHRIVGYLKGLLSNHDRHELEKEVMQDSFDEEAFEGLNLLTGEELESDMKQMEALLDKRTHGSERKIGPVLFRIAAGILLITGLGTVLYLVVFDRSKEHEIGYVAESREAFQPAEGNEAGGVADRENDASAQQAAPSVPSVMPEERPIDETSPQIEKQVPEKTTSETADTDEQGVAAEKQRLALASDLAAPAEVPSQKMAAPAVASERGEMTAAEAGKSIRNDSVTVIGYARAPARLNSYTARVVDQSGSPVSGVTVHEMGVIKGAVTDRNGVFSMAVSQPSSIMTLSSVAFKESDLAAGDLAAGGIRPGDETLSLKEVVISGTIVQKMAVAQGEPASPPSAVPPESDLLPTFEVTIPVPPGGSLRTFKRMVEGNLDTVKLAASEEKMAEVTGRHWIDLTMKILVDGSVGDVRFDTLIPQAVTASYRESIESLPSWQPALQGNTPVESEVEMRFVFSIEQ